MALFSAERTKRRDEWVACSGRDTIEKKKAKWKNIENRYCKIFGIRTEIKMTREPKEKYYNPRLLFMNRKKKIKIRSTNIWTEKSNVRK